METPKKILVRVPEAVHQRAKSCALLNSQSLNAFCLDAILNLCDAVADEAEAEPQALTDPPSEQ